MLACFNFVWIGTQISDTKEFEDRGSDIFTTKESMKYVDSSDLDVFFPSQLKVIMHAYKCDLVVTTVYSTHGSKLIVHYVSLFIFMSIKSSVLHLVYYYCA